VKNLEIGTIDKKLFYNQFNKRDKKEENKLL
jgi:hypothetical protein